MNVADRVQAILLTPGAAWRVIARESDRPATLLLHYVAVLAAIPAVADFIGFALIGFRVQTGAVARLNVVPALLTTAFDYLMAFIVVGALAIIAYLSAPLFQAERNFSNAFRLVVYGYTPAWLAGVFLLVPGLHFLVMFGLYGLFILYKGMPLMMRTPAQTSFLFAAAITGCAVILALIIGALRALIFSLPGII